MQSMKKLNGYRHLIGQSNSQFSLSCQGIQPPSSLGFPNSLHPVNIKKDHHLGRYDRWDKGHQHQREVLWQHLVVRGRQQVNQRMTGILLAAALTLLGGIMLTAVFANEAVLLKLESNQERIK
jgi:hypothetical protein